MPMQTITKHNIGEHTKRVEVLERFRFKGAKDGRVLPGDFVVMSGHELYDALNRKLVKLAIEPEVKEVVEEKVKSKRKRKKS